MTQPRFELTRIYEDGTREPPEIVPVTAMPWETKMDRRGFLGTGLAAAAVLAAFGVACASSRPKKTRIKKKNKYGRTVTETLPCGSPIPPGATCTCNCVRVSTGRRTGSSCRCNLVCSCNKVCTCVPICQAHKLLHNDPLVRTMARQLLLIMGAAQFEYLHWAARKAKPALRARIHDVIAAIKQGDEPDPSVWPSVAACARYLGHEDPVLEVMAAQMLQQKLSVQSVDLAEPLRVRVAEVLAEAPKMHWRHHAA